MIEGENWVLPVP